MTVYELMTFLAEHSAEEEVLVNVAEGDYKPIIAIVAGELVGGVCLYVDNDDEEEA